MNTPIDTFQYGFDKHRLPKGFSYPLGRTALDAALRGHNIRHVHAVYYWLTRDAHRVMRADYCGESRTGWAAAGRSAITVYAVRSPDRRLINQILLADVLPSLCAWLARAEHAGNV